MNKGSLVTISSGHFYPNYSAFHSTLVAAQMAEKEVSFYVSGCTTSNNFPHIATITVR